MNIRKIVFSMTVLAGLSACASLTPTKEVTEGYRIYDIQGVSDHGMISGNLKTAMQKNAQKVTFTNDIPPHPLPEKPGRFTTVNPFGNSGLGALMAAQGASLKIPKCENSIITATSHDKFAGSENTTFFVCLLPYVGGYHLDVYYTFTKESGGYSPEALGKTLAQSVVGDSSQFIPRTLADLEGAVQQAGGAISIVESYP